MHALRTEDRQTQQDDTACMALDDEKLVGIETCQLKTTPCNTEGACTPHWSRVDWGQASKTEAPGAEIHCIGNFSSMEGSSMVASMFFSSVGRHWESRQGFWRNVEWMARRLLGGFSDFLMTEGDISANACQGTCRLSWARWRRCIKWGALSITRETRRCSLLCTCCTNSGAILSSFWRSSLFEVMANWVFW